MSLGKFTNNKTLLLWLLLFIILLMVVIAISGFIYISAINIIEEDLEQTYRLELDRLKYLIDEKLYEVRRLATEQSFSTDVKHMYHIDSISAKDLLILRDIQNDLKIYCLSNQYIEDIVLGFLDVNKAISNKSIYKIDEVSSRLLDNLLDDEMKRRTYCDEFYIIQIQEQSKNKIQIIYRLGLPLGTNNSYNSFIMISLEPSTIFNIVAAKENKILMIKLDDIIVYINSDGMVESEDILNNIDDYVLFKANSDASEFEFGYYVSKKVAFQKINEINQSTWISLTFLIIFFVIVMTVFIRINYNPIHRIFTKLNQNYSNNTDNITSNEIKYIENSLTKIFIERQNLIKTVEEQNHALDDYVILRLLKGEMDDISVLSDFKKNHDEFSYDNYLVLVTKPINYNIPSNDFSSPLYALKMAQGLIKNTYDELVNTSYKIVSIEIDDCIVSIVNYNLDIQMELKNSLMKVTAVLKNIYNITIAVSISKSITLLSDVNSAYTQTKEGIEYCQLKGINYIDYDKVKHDNISNNSYSSLRLNNINNTINNLIIAGKFDSFLYMIDEIFEIYFGASNSVSIIKFNIYELTHIIFSALIEFSTISCIKIETETIAYQLLDSQSIELLKQLIIKQITQINNKYQIQLSNKTKKLVSEITEYILNNYNDYDLCVNKIANEFNLTSSYLSKFFKTETSFKLHNFIQSVRIRHAKQILHMYSVYVVAQRVGFNDASSFIKIFKANEGITPGQYKKNIID